MVPPHFVMFLLSISLSTAITLPAFALPFPFLLMCVIRHALCGHFPLSHPPPNHSRHGPPPAPTVRDEKQAVELERQSFEAKSSVVVKDTEVRRLREELEAASQAKMFFEDELIALRDQNKAHADAMRDEDPSKGNQRDLFEGGGGCASAILFSFRSKAGNKSEINSSSTDVLEGPR